MKKTSVVNTNIDRGQIACDVTCAESDEMGLLRLSQVVDNYFDGTSASEVIETLNELLMDALHKGCGEDSTYTENGLINLVYRITELSKLLTNMQECRSIKAMPLVQMEDLYGVRIENVNYNLLRAY